MTGTAAATRALSELSPPLKKRPHASEAFGFAGAAELVAGADGDAEDVEDVSSPVSEQAARVAAVRTTTRNEAARFTVDLLAVVRRSGPCAAHPLVTSR
jgi:hypothetical protein